MPEERIKGQASGMCPEPEIQERISNKLVHRLERHPGTGQPDHSRMVKAFTRSAAGRKLQDPQRLRPPAILRKTVSYLLGDLVDNKEICLSILYDFLVDRLRAVRQDMIIQNLPAKDCLDILEPIIKFHAFFAYKLSPLDVHNFDPVINKNLLQDYLKSLLVMYDELNLSRPFFETLYLVLNLGAEEALKRALSIPKCQRNKTFNLALTMALSFHKNNFIRVCKVMVKLPVLLRAIASLHLPSIRLKFYNILSISFANKQLGLDLKIIQHWLLYNNIQDLIKDLKLLQLNFQNNCVMFEKKALTKMSPPGHCNFVDNSLTNTKISKILLFED